MCSLIAGLTAASALVGAYGQHQQAQAQADAANAQAEAAESNAKIENKRQEIQADKYAQEDLKRRAQARLAAGKITANAGTAGLSMDTGTSAFDMLSSSEAAYQNDKAISLANQREDNYASRLQENNYRTQASAYRAQADNIMNNAKWGGISTILGTAATISGGIGGSGSTGSTANQWTGYTPIYKDSSGNIIKNKSKLSTWTLH